ncbi:hypothetical protein ILFOPFJJ_06679 [Ensifer psoraleae]|nr:hypothetical protein [Sinorhizobium psoraleae]
MGRFEGKAAVVTGAGIGKACAPAIAREGGKVRRHRQGMRPRHRARGRQSNASAMHLTPRDRAILDLDLAVWIRPWRPICAARCSAAGRLSHG